MAGSHGIRVATFNLRGCLALDGVNIWPLRRGLVKRLLQAHPADVFCFQEMLWPNLISIRRALPGFRCIRGKPSGRAVGVYNAIFYRARLPLLDSGSFWLAQDPARRATSWGAKLPRVANWAHLDTEQGPLLIINLHLDHVSSMARVEASLLVLRRLRAAGWPQVPAAVLGDFNANPGGDVHTIWREAGFADAWQSAGFTDGTDAFTFHGFTGRRDPAETRIDWILHDPSLAASQVQIVKDAAPPRYPSDHFPVFATLAPRPGPTL